MIATLSIMVYNEDAAQIVNTLLHDYRDCVLGRMGLPVREKGVNVISIVMDADSARINALSGKLGCVEGVKAKALYGK